MIGENVTLKRAAAYTAVTAAGSGDNTAITGVIIDRKDTNYALEVCIAVPYTTALGAKDATLTFKSASIQHSDASDLTGAAAYATLESETGTAIVTAAGAGTVTGVKKYNVHLGGAKRYVRFDMTPDLSAANTDTAGIGATVAIFAGENQLPAL